MRERGRLSYTARGLYDSVFFNINSCAIQELVRHRGQPDPARHYDCARFAMPVEENIAARGRGIVLARPPMLQLCLHEQVSTPAGTFVTMGKHLQEKPPV